MIKVWFNHWFSTSYRLIELMKQDEAQDIYVVGTNRQADSVIKLVCDEWYTEPDVAGDDYVEFCLAFCQKHGIDVFVPRREMIAISRNRKLFEEKNIRVMLDDYSIVSVLNDKVKTYELLRDVPGIHIPEFYLVNDAESFAKAYHKLKETYATVCMKFVRDEGGMSFRKIVEVSDKFQALKYYPGTGVSFEDVYETFCAQGTFDDLMVMPYLPDDEISVDCLQTPQGLIAVTRRKGPVRQELVIYDEYILDMSRKIMEKLDLKNPCNIQFKLCGDIPYLLEINPRMSGGLQMSCLASGVNIPNIALNRLLGKQIDWEMRQEECVVSYIEIPKIIS